jgi:hypothetical protein
MYTIFYLNCNSEILKKARVCILWARNTYVKIKRIWYTVFIMENPSWFREPQPVPERQEDTVLTSILEQIPDEETREKVSELRQAYKDWELEINKTNPITAFTVRNAFIADMRNAYPEVEFDDVLLHHMVSGSTVLSGRNYTVDLPSHEYEEAIRSGFANYTTVA